jgi:hypothetical protein
MYDWSGAQIKEDRAESERESPSPKIGKESSHSNYDEKRNENSSTNLGTLSKRQVGNRST